MNVLSGLWLWCNFMLLANLFLQSANITIGIYITFIGFPIIICAILMIPNPKKIKLNKKI